MLHPSNRSEGSKAGSNCRMNAGDTSLGFASSLLRPGLYGGLLFWILEF